MMNPDDESSSEGSGTPAPQAKKKQSKKKPNNTANNDNNNDGNDNDNPQEESFMDKVKRSVNTCCQSTGLCCFKFKEQSNISHLEYKITQRQKKFGVDYLTLVEQKSSQGALKQCLKEALIDISENQKLVNSHFDNIDEKADEVKKNIENGPESKAPSQENKPKPKPKKKRAPPKKQEEDDDPEETPEEEEETSVPKKSSSAGKQKRKKSTAKPNDDKEKFSIDDE